MKWKYSVLSCLLQVPFLFLMPSLCRAVYGICYSKAHRKLKGKCQNANASDKWCVKSMNELNLGVIAHMAVRFYFIDLKEWKQ